jgi:hypothetical protein
MKIRRIVTFTIFLFSLCPMQSFACGINVKDMEPKWKFPNDRGFIEKSSKVGVVEGLKLAEEINFQLITYKPNGLLMKAPDGHGWWEFRETYRFLYKGKPIAIAGTAYFPTTVKNEKGSGYAGCVTEVVIYDEDGDGSYETVVPYAFKIDHVPAWARRRDEK